MAILDVMDQRQVDWPDCLNARDVGGTRIAGGGVIRANALFRSDHHGRLTAAGIAAVRATGVSRILDLRTAEECERDPSPFTAESFYRHVPFEDPADPTRPDGTLAEVYRETLDRYRSFVAAAVTEVADAPPGAVVAQCHAGKDRTGLLVALVLRSVGVDPTVVAEEYALSHAALRGRYDPVLATINDPDEYRRTADRMSASAETMLSALSHVDERYGGVAPYLGGAGVTPQHVWALRHRLVAGEEGS